MTSINGADKPLLQAPTTCPTALYLRKALPLRPTALYCVLLESFLVCPPFRPTEQVSWKKIGMRIRRLWEEEAGADDMEETVREVLKRARDWSTDPGDQHLSRSELKIKTGAGVGEGTYTSYTGEGASRLFLYSKNSCWADEGWISDEGCWADEGWKQVLSGERKRPCGINVGISDDFKQVRNGERKRPCGINVGIFQIFCCYLQLCVERRWCRQTIRPRGDGWRAV